MGAIIVGVAAVAALWQGLLLLVAAVFPEQVVAGYGTIEVGQWVEAALFRTETTITAPMAGTFRPSQPAGERIAARGVVGEIKRSGGQSVAVKTRASGLIAYTVDGQEQTLTPAMCLADPRDAFQKAKSSRARQSGRGAVRAGEPVAKLVDDRQMYLLYQSGHRDGPPPRPGDQLWARDHEALIPLSVASVIADGGTHWVALRTERFPPAWLDQRCVDVYLVFSRFKGTVVPRRCLRLRDGQLGVTIIHDGRPSFQAVELLGQDRHRAVVKGLREGDILVP